MSTTIVFSFVVQPQFKLRASPGRMSFDRTAATQGDEVEVVDQIRPRRETRHGKARQPGVSALNVRRLGGAGWPVACISHRAGVMDHQG